MQHLILMRRLALAAVLLGLGVVVFGAYVRLTWAGLGCPDWPGCYGHFSPIGAEQAGTEAMDAGKAWREMIHRYAAALLGLLILAIAVVSWRGRGHRAMPRLLPLALVGLVVFQGTLGMLTVTWLVKPLIVTLHLAFGITTVTLLWWLYLGLRRVTSDGVGWQLSDAPRQPSTQARWAQRLAILGLVLLAFQVVLGGWVSTNYAAVACPDFPTCQLAWWPEAHYEEGFTLWRGLGINYEGGVLEHPARVAIHFTHRLGAVVVTLSLLLAAIVAWRSRLSATVNVAAAGVVAALALQLFIGIYMVLGGFPISLATAHNAGAAVLVLATAALLRALHKS